MHRLTRNLVLAVSVALAGASCDDDAEKNPDANPQTGTSEIRIIHASPDAPAVDIYASGATSPLVTNLAYGQVTEYLEVAAASYTFEIRAAGDPASSMPVFTSSPVALAEDDRVSVLAAGLIGSTGAADRFRLLPFVEDFAPATDKARVRIVHASADAPTVAIDVGNDGDPELTSVARFAESGASGVELPAGEALQIGIWTGTPRARVTAFTTPALPAGGELFVIAAGLLSERPNAEIGFSLLAVASTGLIGFIRQNPVVYALHASPDAPAVDIYAGDAMLAGGITFGKLSGTIQVPPASYDLDFYAAGTGPGKPVVSLKTPSLSAGERYLAIASGFLVPGATEPGLLLIAVVDAFATDPSGGRVRVVHASPDAPTVDVGLMTGEFVSQPALVQNLEFAGSSAGAGLEIGAGTIKVGIAPAGSAEPVATFDVPVAASTRAFAVAAGVLGEDKGRERFRIVVVNTSATPWAAGEIFPNE